MGANKEVSFPPSVEQQIDQTTDNLIHHSKLEKASWGIAGVSLAAAAAALGPDKVSTAINFVSYNNLSNHKDAIQDIIRIGWGGLFTGPVSLASAMYHDKKVNDAKEKIRHLKNPGTVYDLNAILKSQR